ncbi:hypothetical protein PFISCL1PPCAC_20449, partial [Pristionchus fissidentatus]
MGYLLTLGCYLVAFAPATVLFLRLAASDPLKTILFVIGAFVWLLSLLVTSLVWFIIPPLDDHLWFALSVGIIFQEAARVACFFMLRAAQKGLASMANPTSAQHVSISGVMSLANSRHLLAVVIGLGMGTTAGLFLTMNAFDAISGSGVVGGLRETLNGLPPRSVYSRLLPLHWALNAMLLSLTHVVWTVLVWDSCHHFALRRDAASAASTTTNQNSGSAATASTPLLHNQKVNWFLPAIVAVVTHVVNSAMSYLSGGGYTWLALSSNALMLLILIGYCYVVVRHESPFELLKEVVYALRDWVTLTALREYCCKKTSAAPAADATEGESNEMVIRDGRNNVRRRR